MVITNWVQWRHFSPNDWHCIINLELPGFVWSLKSINSRGGREASERTARFLSVFNLKLRVERRSFLRNVLHRCVHELFVVKLRHFLDAGTPLGVRYCPFPLWTLVPPSAARRNVGVPNVFCKQSSARKD